MKLEEKPKFFSSALFNILVTIISFLALFGFWEKLEDSEKLLYIVVPAIIIFFVGNVIIYYRKVSDLYKHYKKIFDNNQALSQNYKDNQILLKQERYNNEILRDFVNNSMSLMVVYNELSKEERTELKKAITSKFVNRLEGESKSE